MTAAGPGLTAEKDAELVFAVTEDHLVIDVPRGENAKRTLKHSGVVRWLQSAAGDSGQQRPRPSRSLPTGVARIFASSRSFSRARDRRVVAAARTVLQERSAPARVNRRTPFAPAVAHYAWANQRLVVMRSPNR